MYPADSAAGAEKSSVVRELEAQVRKPAEAEKYRLEKLAKANRYTLLDSRKMILNCCVPRRFGCRNRKSSIIRKSLRYKKYFTCGLKHLIEEFSAMKKKSNCCVTSHFGTSITSPVCHLSRGYVMLCLPSTRIE